MSNAEAEQPKESDYEKFTSWVFAADVAAIGFAIQKTAGQPLGPFHITLGLAVAGFAASIYYMWLTLGPKEATGAVEKDKNLSTAMALFATGMAFFLIWHISGMYMLRPESDCGC
jgi:hypothetical protein